MTNSKSSVHMNDFTDYRLTGDLRVTAAATVKQVGCYRDLLEPLGKSSTILDDACRDGRIALPLSRFYKSLTGVEINPKLVEIANSLSSEVKNVQFIAEDVRNLSLPDNTFDGVLSAFSS